MGSLTVRFVPLLISKTNWGRLDGRLNYFHHPLVLFPLFSAALLLLWAFNPLGSQASLRGAHLRDGFGSDIYTNNVTYMNPDFVGGMPASKLYRTDKFSTPPVRSLYTSAVFDIVSKIQYPNSHVSTSLYNDIISTFGNDIGIRSATDSWSNIRIPLLEYLDLYDADDPRRWLHPSWLKYMQG
jgi:hypothetical protein